MNMAGWSKSSRSILGWASEAAYVPDKHHRGVWRVGRLHTAWREANRLDLFTRWCLAVVEAEPPTPMLGIQ